MRFCPKCGKKGISGEFCSDCAPSELNLGFKDMVMTICAMCRTYLTKNKYVKYERLEEAIADYALTKIKNPGHIPIRLEPHIPENLKRNPGVNKDIEITVKADGAEFIIPARLEFTLCKRCGKSGSHYYEGILQLRDTNEKVVKFVKDFVHKNEPHVFITNEFKVKDGYDLYFSSQKYLNMLGKKLKSTFNGEFKSTAKLFTWNKQTSKDVHRVNILFRLRKYKKGDIIEKGDRKIKITDIGERVQGKDMQTGKRVFV